MALNTPFTNKSSDLESDHLDNENVEIFTSDNDNAFENDESLKTDSRIVIDGVPYIKVLNEESNKRKPHNEKPLFKHCNTFELEKFEKNILLIFNHKNFVGNEPRLGTEKDVEALSDTFSKVGFEIVPHDDCTRAEVFNALETFASNNFTNYGCIAIAVLTHGMNGILGAKDGSYSEMDIWNYLKAYDKPSLITKPRILIIQACRGEGCMQGVPIKLPEQIELDEDIAEQREFPEDLVFQSPYSMFQDDIHIKGVPVRPTDNEIDDEEEYYYLPEESDILILHSSSRGKRSCRDLQKGSWFIQSLCNKINELSPTHDLESILTEVKREVAIDRDLEEFNSETVASETIKQMPVVTSTLTRKLYLRNFRDPLGSIPLQLQHGHCSCNLNHIEHINNCINFAEWMTRTETFLQTENLSIDDIIELSVDLSELKVILNNINSIGPRLCKISCGEGAAATNSKCVTTIDNRRFDAIVEKTHVLSKKIIYVHEPSEEFDSPITKREIVAINLPHNENIIKVPRNNN